MAWQSPKTDWGRADGVRDSDLNRIEGNILHLYGMSVNADITIYVNGSSGNDTSGSGTAAAPYKTITKALSVLPRNIDRHVVVINISAGTYLDAVTIRGFSGVITLRLTGTTTINSLAIDGCTVAYGGAQLNVSNGISLTNGAGFYGSDIIYVGGANQVGISVRNGSCMSVLQAVNVSNATSVAIDVYSQGRFYASTIGGSNNSTGIIASTGGVVCYGSMSMTATTKHMASTGGRIYSGAQTSIPNY